MNNFDRYAAAYFAMNEEARLLILGFAEDYARLYPAPRPSTRLRLVTQNLLDTPLAGTAGHGPDGIAAGSVRKPVLLK